MLEKLYKRNVNNTINQWQIIVENDCYWTEFGQVDGIITKSDKVFAIPKNIGKVNETSASEQALKEAISIWKKKIKSENFVINIEDVDKLAFNPPMLAQKYELYSNDIKFAQPKLDGIRCNIHFENDKVIALSRKNNPFYTVEHIKESLFTILQNNPTIHLDGELYNHKFHDDFNKVVSLVKKEKLEEDDYEEVAKYVRYNIYDLWDDENPNLSFKERNKIINELFQDILFVDIVETYEINDEDDIQIYFDKFISMGYEGLILRKDAPYEHKRSKNLLKHKEFKDEEFEIIDICEGKNKGIAEYAWIKLNEDKMCKATFAFSDNECKDLLKKKEDIIGKLATVKYFGYTTDGSLRFPILKAIRDYE